MDMQLGSCLDQAQINGVCYPGGCLAYPAVVLRKSSNLPELQRSRCLWRQRYSKYYAWGGVDNQPNVRIFSRYATLVVSCPPDRDVSGCSSQSQIDAAFGKLALFILRRLLPWQKQPTKYSAPSACGGSVTVDYYAWDKCETGTFAPQPSV